MCHISEGDVGTSLKLYRGTSISRHVQMYSTICLLSDITITYVSTHPASARSIYYILWIYILFLVSWGGVRLSPLGTSATNWRIVPAPDDR
jgi:hypothetical protein